MTDRTPITTPYDDDAAWPEFEDRPPDSLRQLRPIPHGGNLDGRTYCPNCEPRKEEPC